MIYLDNQLSEEEINDLYRGQVQTPSGPLFFTHLLAYECHLYDEIEPSCIELVALQNLAKRILKRIGAIREANLYELTRVLVNGPKPAQLREKTK
jgi:hypothetical protein